MFTTREIEFGKSGVLNNLVLQYLEKNKNLDNFYGYYPDVDGFTSLLKSKPYQDFNHETLSLIVEKQSSLVNNSSEATLLNIKKLAQKNTYTVTTGHQLCLFTGPLYFIHKLFSAINLAETLKKEFPDYDFVPVYWMASEDHDFEEVNNFNLFGKNIKWNSEQGGAVGDFKTESLKELLPQLQEVFGKGLYADELIALFEQAYLGHSNLANATRYLVNALFGEYGLVIVDGNDTAFKEQFKAQFSADIFENTPCKLVSSSIVKLGELGYHAQVNPRDINCFYLQDGSRMRIEKSGDRFKLVGSETSFSETEMREIIQNSPSRISPNVVLRPLYQQCILPNIAYVGGPGELAYWLEYKSMFEEFNLLFPILVPRNFILVVDKGTKNKLTKLNFNEEDIFKPEQQLINEFQVKSDAVFEVSSEKESLSSFYQTLTDKISAVDKSLAGSVSAEMQKAINGLEQLSGKANKALKQRSETEINQIKAIKQKLFPTGVPQERHDNFATFYLKNGKDFLRDVKNNIHPFEFKQRILTED